MSKKIKVISFLGSNSYKNVKYSFKDLEEEKIVETKFVQVALAESLGEDVILYVGLTEGEGGSRKNNWESGEKERFNKDTCKKELIYEKGLKEILDEKNICYKDMSIRDGENNDEIWENFQTIFDELEEEDEIYVDITHSFRSIPIIIMSVLNYAKFIKNINIKGIYYGAYEARDKVENIAPIIDLSLYNDLTDWTIGAEKFISTGNSDALIKEINKRLNPLSKKYKGEDEEVNSLNKLKTSIANFSDSLYSLRGTKISDNGLRLKEYLDEISSIKIGDLKPFERILDKIKEMVEPYSGEPISDILYTTKLLAKLGLIQQAFTLLSESILTYLIYKGGLEEDVTKSKIRGYVKDRLYEERTQGTKEYNEDIEECQKKIETKEAVGKYCTKELADLFDEIGKYRNDINHAGYKDDWKDRLRKFEDKIQDFIKEIYKLIDPKEIDIKEFKELDSPNLILLFSHKLTENQIENAKGELQVNDFIYLPKELQEKWSSIDPSLENIDKELEGLENWIFDISNKGDYVLIQGDYGATYNMINFSRSQNLIPIYSTSKRQAKEVKDNKGKVEITQVFEHIRFREY